MYVRMLITSIKMQHHLPEVSRKAEIRRVGGCDRSAVLIE